MAQTRNMTTVAAATHDDVHAIAQRIDEILVTEHDAISATVRQAVAEVLNISVEQVPPDASLNRDLGAESLDHLDLQFRLERAFGIKIPDGGGILQTARRGMEDRFEAGGRFTDAALERLRILMPDLSSDLQPGLEVAAFSDLKTVEWFVRVVALYRSDGALR